jgi:membrane-bound lytic murein transglycosylase D
MLVAPMKRVLILFFAFVMLSACAPLHRKSTPPPQDLAIHPTELPPAGGLLDDEGLPSASELIVDEEIDGEVDGTPLSPQEEIALETQPQIHFDLDGLEIKEMEFYFLYYTRKNRDTFQRWLKRAEPYLPYIRDHFAARGLPEELIYLPFAESGFNPWAYSHAGAAGLWQFMPYTGQRYGLNVDWWIDQRRDPYLATKAAADYLEKLHKDFGDWYLALAAYNAGEGRIARALSSSGCDNFFDMVNGKTTLKKETKHYVPKFLAILKIIRNLESLGFDPLNMDPAAVPARIEVKGGTDLLALSGSCGMSWDEFRRYNPSFKRMISPPEMTSTVYLPLDKEAKALAYLEKPEATPHAGYTRHKVRSGESLWVISRRYDVPIAIIKKLNEKASNTLRPGEWLMVPGRNTATAANTLERTRTVARERSNYVVQPGDTLWSIANSSGISVSTLLKANGLNNPKTLQIGQKIHIPSASGTPTRLATTTSPKTDAGRIVQYQVKTGDTLWGIARKFGVSHQDLQAWNDLKGNAHIRPGDSLKVFVR